MMNYQPPTTPLSNRDVSPRKKKGQISFAQPNFSLDLESIDNADNKRVQYLLLYIINSQNWVLICFLTFLGC